jgi:hypothetical protein
MANIFDNSSNDLLSQPTLSDITSVGPSVSLVNVPTSTAISENSAITNTRKTIKFKDMARLSTLPSTGYTSQAAEGRVTIYMPHLPEEIELMRENSYDESGNIVMPDGLWIYRYTSPLEISLQFTLHAWDDLCPEGSKTLLDLAARLHTLLLPASNDVFRSQTKAPSAQSDSSRGISLNALQGTNVGSEDALASVSNSVSTSSQLKFPPACSLRLIQAGANGFGVHAVGFIKAAGIILHGPFLQTIDSSDTFNLPSAVTYKFTFVHNPSYTGTLQINKFVNVSGPDVFQRLYNTYQLAAQTGNTYADVEEAINS